MIEDIMGKKLSILRIYNFYLVKVLFSKPRINLVTTKN